MSGSSRCQPEWKAKAETEKPSLKLFNSLTKKKETFIPKNGNSVTWYNCGPTVYDASHMGHARTYLTFDILRRILSGYFGYDIFYVMNITDVDDKIIKRARQNHLFNKYLGENKELNLIFDDVNEAVKGFSQQVSATEDPDKKTMQEKMLKAVNEAALNAQTLIKEGKPADEIKDLLFSGSGRDVLSEWLDQKRGSSVTDNKIFESLPQHWEEKYWEDMKALNIDPPDALTRVSEYVPEIVGFIQEIINKGYGYESQGSVYFDVSNFNNNDKHYYAKLVPEAFGDKSALESGEGSLSSTGEKKSANDFALWKRSKPGEPSWQSQWGLGRPGWHIECSAMASQLLGQSMDIHSGGIDLKFPHHDNELAQSEAFYDNDQWTRYFLHSGHLTIAGCKMSKSLKNFITIQEVLKKFTARQLRLTFLLHSWKDTLDYSNYTMENAIGYERNINEFMLMVKHIVRTNVNDTISGSFNKWGPDEIQLNADLIKCKSDVHKAMCDNIDTKAVLESIRQWVSVGNAYITKKSNNQANAQLLKNGCSFITYIFKTVGLNESNEDIGFTSSNQSGSGSKEEDVMPYLSALADFRDGVRKQAREIKHQEILELCDKLRNDVLPNLGVRLEDKENVPTVIKLVDKEELLREKKQKQEIAEKKRLEKEKKKAEADVKAQALEAQRKIPPGEMFKGDTDKYSKWDEQGIPTHDIKGEEISQAQIKKLKKLYAVQEKKYAAYMKSKSEP